MGIFDALRATPESARDIVVVAQENNTLREEVEYQHTEIRLLQEDMLKISDAFDNAGWSPLPQDESAEMKLDTVKKIAKLGRAVAVMNPFVKRGVDARIAYIWGKGVTFDNVDDIQEQIDDSRRKLFTPQAFEEYERVLATDGNAFTALRVSEDDEEQLAFRIGLDDIVGCIANPLDREEIWYYKRQYTVRRVDKDTGQEKTEAVEKYYASLPYWERLQKAGKKLPRRWNKVGVEQNYVIQHVTVNKQIGWRWGVPDVTSVIFWAKAYKEYLEDNAALVKAYSRLAWQYKGSSQSGMAAAAQTMRPPTRDPMTGESRDIGGTAISGLGGELTPVAATGSSVDFSKGSALASAIAAGLGVSQTVITSSSGDSGSNAAESTLDLPTLKTMESRQQVHTERFMELFGFWGADVPGKTTGKKDAEEALPPKAGAKPGAPKPAAGAKTDPTKADTPEQESVTDGQPVVVSITWPQIESDSTKDRVTALGTATELGVLFKQEARKEMLDVFGISPFKPWDVLPTIEDDPAAKMQQEVDAQNEEIAFQREQQSVIAKQGVTGGTAAKGGSQTKNNSARDNRKKDTGNR